MSVVLSEHLPLLASAPDGIQKLRGLILELAVRGKLVPQDPNDEPASVLLKRIAKERARLEADKTNKKSKATPLSDDGDWPFELPMGWQWSRVSDLSTVVRGVSYDKAQAAETHLNGYLPLLRGHNINQKLNLDNLVFLPKTCVSSEQLVRQGDIVVAMSSGSAHLVGKAAQANVDLNVGFGAFCGVIRAYSAELHRYFGFFFQTPLYRNRVAGHGKGIGINNLQKGALLSLECPLPPIAEQHRIVAKVDELMALCDQLEAEQADAESAHAKLVQTLLDTLTQSTDAADLAANWQRLSQHFDTLFTTEASLNALKQTILRLAVMGKLVPQDPDNEPADELLKRIAKERARLEAEGVCRKAKLVPAADGDAFYSLPNNWRWSALDSLVRVMDSGWSPACIETLSPSNDIWGVLKTTAVQTFQYLEYENKELPAHLEPRPECEVAAGDILITRAGPKNRVAISCLVEATRPHLMISDKIIRFHLVEGGMYEKFVALCLNAGATASYLEKAKSGMAASQMNITQEKLRAAPIPICSTAEQHRIVAKVDELMALCDRLKTDLADARTKQARLASTLIDTALQAA